MYDMAFLLKHTLSFPFQLAMAVFLTTFTCLSLSSPLILEKKISTISAAPTPLPDHAPPLSSPPSLSPDITPLLPSSPSGIAPSPTDLLPTIPANPSPPNPDEIAGPGPNSPVSPSGSFSAMASSTSVAAPLSSAALCFGVVLFCLLHLLGGYSMF